jgi:hypothetical protein
MDGVRFTISRISFGRRLELTRRVRELGRRLEFQQAGQTIADKLDAALTTGEVDRLYMEWGLRCIEGLTIDGRAADVAAVIEDGPEGLCREIVQEIRRECGLTEDERKN